MNSKTTDSNILQKDQTYTYNTIQHNREFALKN